MISTFKERTQSHGQKLINFENKPILPANTFLMPTVHRATLCHVPRKTLSFLCRPTRCMLTHVCQVINATLGCFWQFTESSKIKRYCIQSNSFNQHNKHSFCTPACTKSFHSPTYAIVPPNPMNSSIHSMSSYAAHINTHPLLLLLILMFFPTALPASMRLHVKNQCFSH